ncbi:MAG: hypothetical protein GY950_13040 [bacterium]|nr:hypothetical protein [bacterium]
MALLKFVVFIIMVCFIVPSSAAVAGEYQLQSPDKRITVTITTADKIHYSVYYDSKQVIKPSPVSLTLHPGIVLGKKPEVKKTAALSVNKKITPVVPQKNAVIPDRYNQLTLHFKVNFGGRIPM